MIAVDLAEYEELRKFGLSGGGCPIGICGCPDEALCNHPTDSWDVARQRKALADESPTITHGHCGGALVHDPHVWRGDHGPRSCVGTIPSPGGSR